MPMCKTICIEHYRLTIILISIETVSNNLKWKVTIKIHLEMHVRSRHGAVVRESIIRTGVSHHGNHKCPTQNMYFSQGDIS